MDEEFVPQKIHSYNLPGHPKHILLSSLKKDMIQFNYAFSCEHGKSIIDFISLPISLVMTLYLSGCEIRSGEGDSVFYATLRGVKKSMESGLKIASIDEVVGENATPSGKKKYVILCDI
jgi:hypothetical protein